MNGSSVCRRDFLRLAGLTGVGLVAAACAGSTSSASPSPSTSSGPPGTTPGAPSAPPVPAEFQQALDFAKANAPGITLDLLQAAKAEGTVMLYAGTTTDSTKNVMAGFSELFPFVKVDEYEATIGQLRQRFLAEEQAGKHVADLYTESDPGTLANMIEQGLFMEYTISTADAFDPKLCGPGYWYPLRIAMVGIAWNSTVVSEGDATILREWKGDLDPRWKGKCAVVDPSQGGVAYLPWYAWSKLYGDDFIKQIGTLKPRVLSGTNPASAALASGDISVLLNASETGLYPLYLKGAPIRWALPAPGVGPVTGMAISANAPHPNAAKLYQEYQFSEPGYKRWQEYTGIPARKGMKDQRKVGQESWYQLPDTFFDYDPAAATDDTKRIIQLFKDYVA